MSPPLGTACIVNVGQRLLPVDCRRLASEIFLPGILPPHHLTDSVTISSAMVETHRLQLTDCLAGTRMHEVTRILSAIEQGDPLAAEQLLPLVYEELRKLAAAKLAQEKPGQTLQATALVHEAYLRLAGGTSNGNWDNRGHFFAAAAESMRRILIESGRRKQARQRGGEAVDVSLDRIATDSGLSLDDMLDFDAALVRLEAIDSDAARLAKLRVFAGLTVEEAAAAVGTPSRSAHRDWAFAQAWLFRELRKADG